MGGGAGMGAAQGQRQRHGHGKGVVVPLEIRRTHARQSLRPRPYPSAHRTIHGGSGLRTSRIRVGRHHRLRRSSERRDRDRPSGAGGPLRGRAMPGMGRQGQSRLLLALLRRPRAEGTRRARGTLSDAPEGTPSFRRGGLQDGGADVSGGRSAFERRPHAFALGVSVLRVRALQGGRLRRSAGRSGARGIPRMVRARDRSGKRQTDAAGQEKVPGTHRKICRFECKKQSGECCPSGSSSP
mmetsp:Transcript_23229/g.53076  ORF Transcript_23229/g.53076 Transcript_23229/m.53076 type:complete len:240 (-) Transcript_23229:288-1007(-)